ncbi:hypothetical protein BH23CHL2_BH23CHL2_31570 [soil metagenome]
MRRRIRNPVMLMLTVALLIVPFQVAATGIDPGAVSGDRDLLFSPTGVGLEAVEYADGFESPVHVTNAGDGSGRLFVSELAGRVWIVEDDQVLPEPFLDISEIVRDEDGEQGFFSIEFHPEYSTNGYFFAVYTRQPAGANVLARFQVSEDDPNRADPESLLELISIPDTISNHNGGDIAFGSDGYLYYGTGDEGGSGDPNRRAQDGLSLFGKMLRLDVDSAEPYAIPPDNPFVDDPDVRDEIWSTGLRNPWRYSFDSLTGDLYIGDVGQNVWEEINVEPAGSPGGLNYGWPIMEGLSCYPENVQACDMTGLTLPILVYSQDGEPGERAGCSVVGGEVYRGQEYPFMDGAYIFADWCEGRIWAGYQDSIGQWQMTELLDTFINWTTIGADEAGELYGTDLIGGRLFRFVFSQVVQPEVSAITPASALAGDSAIEVSIAGSGFAESAEALWDGSPLPTTYVDSNEVRAALAASLLAEPGVHEITVRNGPDGQPSDAMLFNVADGPFANPSFASVWNRTDQLVADGVVSRTWIWGPGPNEPARFERYVESPGGERMVLYFDKSRMEITQPGSDPSSVWYVTNGLLVVELMTGRMQVGHADFIDGEPAGINIAGDADDPNGVTYATLAGLRDAPPSAEGSAVASMLSADGTVSQDASLAEFGVQAGPLAEETGHRTASVFWDFMNSRGPVAEGGITREADLFLNAYFATGFPITEAYWTTIRVSGVDHQVLLQCFERRCLTYTPSNDPGWQVEAGNVGLHYYAWRYGE